MRKPVLPSERRMPFSSYGGIEEKTFAGDLFECGVYVIACMPARMFYIGSTRRTFHDRWGEHLEALEAGIHPCRQLQADYDEYGEEPKAFWLGIGEISDDPEPAEREWIRFWHARGCCYNSPRGKKR